MTTILLVLLIMSVSVAQARPIEGRVTDANNQVPLQDVNIVIEGTDYGTTSNEDGNFIIYSPPEYEFTLIVSHLGYKPVKVSVTPGDFSFLEIALEMVYLSPERPVVVTSRPQLRTAPVTFSNMTSSQVEESYYAQEIPILLSVMPSVYAYSDAGNPQGYSYLKIRGFDQKRVSVLINGIPLNDPEDHQVYWVDMPDLAANVDDIQVQRGLGYSPYGPSAFGGSVNIVTTPDPNARAFKLTSGFGSYNTRKVSALFSSGIVDNNYQFYGRFSRISSEGFKDNSGFTGWSYFLSGTRFGADYTLTVNLYGGPEELHAAWDGTLEDILDTNRTYNSIQYENTIDSFNQPHYELHHTKGLSPELSLVNSLFYINGRGYWEVMKSGWDGSGEQLSAYGLTSDPDLLSPLVHQLWVDKDQYGWIPRLRYEGDRWECSAGGNLNNFHSHHWGKVIWVEDTPDGIQPNFTDHDYNGDIWEAGIFGHAGYELTDKFTLIGDLQFRHIDAEFQQNEAGAFSGTELNGYEVGHNFLNPKAGLSYQLDKKSLFYLSAGLAQREPSQREYWDAWTGPEMYGIDPLFAQADTIWEGPNAVRVDWSDPLVKPERMIDIESGWKYAADAFNGAINLYWMDFRNEIIFGGGMLEGWPVVGNAGKTLHRGMELEASWQPVKNAEIYGNLTYSKNSFESNDIVGLNPAYEIVSIKGNTIPLFPEIISRGMISYEFKQVYGFNLKPIIGLNYVGKQYLESTNMEDAKVNDYFTVNFRLLGESPPIAGLPKIGFIGVITNLFDEAYETSGYYYEGNYLYPGPGRSYYLEIRLGL